MKTLRLLCLLLFTSMTFPVFAQSGEPRWCTGNGTIPDITTAVGWTWGEVNTSGAIFAGSGPGTTVDTLDGIGVLAIDASCDPGAVTGTYDAFTRTLTVPPVMMNG